MNIDAPLIENISSSLFYLVCISTLKPSWTAGNRAPGRRPHIEASHRGIAGERVDVRPEAASPQTTDGLGEKRPAVRLVRADVGPARRETAAGDHLPEHLERKS